MYFMLKVRFTVTLTGSFSLFLTVLLIMNYDLNFSLFKTVVFHQILQNTASFSTYIFLVLAPSIFFSSFLYVIFLFLSFDHVAFVNERLMYSSFGYFVQFSC